jgi:hypothetical protein
MGSLICSIPERRLDTLGEIGLEREANGLQREANGLEREDNGLERVENYITFRVSVHSIPRRSMPGLGDTPRYL